MVAVLLLVLLAVQAPAQTASALLDRGIELSHQGRFAEAADQFVKALALDPKLAEAHYLLGLVRQQDGRTDAAMQSYRAALKINPQYADAQARVCELMTRASRGTETGYTEAQVACRRANALAPSDPEPYFHLGWLDTKTGNLPGAVQRFQTVLRIDPKFPQVKFELAMALADSQQLARAIPMLKEVVAAEPANGPAKFQLGSALAKSGDCKSAVPLLETAPDVAQKYYVLGTCYKKLGRDADATAAMGKVRELRSGADARMQAKYRAATAHKLLAAGKLEEAIAEYRAALDVQRDPTILIDLAVALLKKGDAPQVIKLLQTESDPVARYQLALAYTQLQQLNEAAAALAQAVQQKPDFVEAWYQIGVTQVTAGKLVPAEDAFRRASALRPDDKQIRLAWAETLRRLGRIEEARAQEHFANRAP
ncbi:MAG: tetratricopeptide repeat protein [Bryobacterales bacterium]|nr:tetratricopeptide repeat protein [Bryobacterales bacterium]